jgi:hypothetical protein
MDANVQRDTVDASNFIAKHQASRDGAPGDCSMSNFGSKVSRRTMFVGATGIGAAALASRLLPGQPAAAPAGAVPKAMPAKGGGYRLSEHVKQYYKTTVI